MGANFSEERGGHEDFCVARGRAGGGAVHFLQCSKIRFAFVFCFKDLFRRFVSKIGFENSFQTFVSTIGFKN